MLLTPAPFRVVTTASEPGSVRVFCYVEHTLGAEVHVTVTVRGVCVPGWSSRRVLVAKVPGFLPTEAQQCEFREKLSLTFFQISSCSPELCTELAALAEAYGPCRPLQQLLWQVAITSSQTFTPAVWAKLEATGLRAAVKTAQQRAAMLGSDPLSAAFWLLNSAAAHSAPLGGGPTWWPAQFDHNSLPFVAELYAHDPEVQVACCTALRRGVASTSEGWFPTLFAAMRRHPAVERVQLAGLEALYHLTTDAEQENPTQAGENGGLELVLAAMAAFPHNVRLLSMACSCVYNLTWRHPGNKALAAQTCVQEAVLTAMRAFPTEDTVQETGCLALSCVGVPGAGVDVVLAAMRTFEQDCEVQPSGCDALRAALRTAALLGRDVLEAAVQAVGTALRVHDECVPVQKSGSLFFRDLCKDVGNQPLVLQAAGLELLVAALDHAPVYACEALRHLLAGGGPIRTRFADLGGVESVSGCAAARGSLQQDPATSVLCAAVIECAEGGRRACLCEGLPCILQAVHLSAAEGWSSPVLDRATLATALACLCELEPATLAAVGAAGDILHALRQLKSVPEAVTPLLRALCALKHLNSEAEAEAAATCALEVMRCHPADEAVLTRACQVLGGALEFVGDALPDCVRAVLCAMRSFPAAVGLQEQACEALCRAAAAWPETSDLYGAVPSVQAAMARFPSSAPVQRWGCRFFSEVPAASTGGAAAVAAAGDGAPVGGGDRRRGRDDAGIERVDPDLLGGLHFRLRRACHGQRDGHEAVAVAAAVR